MPTKTETRKIPTPFYAAAGAGDLAYQQLLKLPERVAELRGRVMELRPVVSEAINERSIRADIDKLRGTAKRNAAALVTEAQRAQEKAVSVYSDLVARGERIVAGRTGEMTVEVTTAKPKAKVGEVKVEATTTTTKAPTAERVAATTTPTATATARPRTSTAK